ncbi:MAG: alkaline phosphatase family protein [Pontiellaceae bacterium]|nr:alkaline phosphatase family protein [Pontiellaceae bacterium]MBN2785670.1 alkaline phosphatase family protein [Pontiellaceae bacterium]
MKKEKLSLFIFIDAFGWEVRQRHLSFLKDLTLDSRPLETIFGYSSACDPSIISGLTPAQHGLWCSYYYDPENSPFKWTRPLQILPDALFRRGRVRHHMSKWIKKKCGITGYFQLYAVPFEHLPLFNYAERKRIWEPDGLPRGKTVFDRMAEAGIPHYVHDSGVPDNLRMERLMTDIQDQRIDFAYCSLGKLDALMHAEGNDSPSISTLLEWYDQQIRALLATAEENYEEVAWYCFTDHGMHNVVESYDLIAEIEALGLEWNRDYIAFYDSTMARIWIFNDTARETIVRELSKHPKGRILSENELKTFGVYFEDGQYGDLIFLMNSGVQIAPGFMGIKACKGMHGYHPADPDSLAAIASNRPIPPDITKIQHIHRLMLNELGIQETS